MGEKVPRAKSTKKCKLHNQTLNELAMLLVMLGNWKSTCEVAAPGRLPIGAAVAKAAGSTEQSDQPKVIDFMYV